MRMTALSDRAIAYVLAFYIVVGMIFAFVYLIYSALVFLNPKLFLAFFEERPQIWNYVDAVSCMWGASSVVVFMWLLVRRTKC